MSSPAIHVCNSPVQYPLFKQEGCIVVVIDILRATSAMVTAFKTGVKEIIPVMTVAEAAEYRDKGYIVAAERNGLVAEGFTMGNSPFCYLGDEIKEKTIVISTTNGTKAILVAKGDAHEIIIGAFLNLQAVVDYVGKQQRDVLFLCAGWKDKFNLEDTLFAGSAAQLLHDEYNYQTECDSAIAAMHLFKAAKPDLNKFLENSSHRMRLKRLDLEKDIEYCLTSNVCNIVPKLKGEVLSL